MYLCCSDDIIVIRQKSILIFCVLIKYGLNVKEGGRMGFSPHCPPPLIKKSPLTGIPDRKISVVAVSRMNGLPSTPTNLWPDPSR